MHQTKAASMPIVMLPAACRTFRPSGSTRTRRNEAPSTMAMMEAMNVSLIAKYASIATQAATHVSSCRSRGSSNRA